MMNLDLLTGRKRATNVHQDTLQATWDCLCSRRCAGATTGLIMEWIKAHRKELVPGLDGRAPDNAGPAERTQHWKTAIGHALDELQAEKKVHCDEVGKRRMHGDERSVPVWRTADDYLALRDHMAWALREKKPESGTFYAANHRKVTKHAIKPAPDWCTTYTMTADAYKWSRRDTTWISDVVNFFQTKNTSDQ